MNAPSSKKILIVNSAYKIRQTIRRELEHFDAYHIDESNDGIEAVEQLNKHSYDLIITDIDLRNLDGWRLTRLVRSGMLKSIASTRIIILSSTHSERIAEATAKEFEVNRFVPITQIADIGSISHQLLKDDEHKTPKSSILVIEDYQDTADLIDRLLHKRFNITHALDGEEGLKIWGEGQFDIVLLDLMLPKLSGEDILKEILKRKPEQTVVMMTAHGDSKKAAELILAGAVDFISKPFKAERLRHVCDIAAHREDFVVSNEQFNEKQSELIRTKNRAQITLQSIADGVITTDVDCIIDYINPVAQKLLNYKSDNVIGKEITEIFNTFHEVSHIPTTNLVKRAITENETQRSTIKTVLKDSDNHELLITQQTAPLRNTMGQAIGAVLIFHDQTEATKFEQRMNFHATHDQLTGLNNRGVFDQEVRLAIHESVEQSVEHCVCQLSLSQFNIINESCGHLAGDKLLQKIARTLEEKVRAPSDTIARIGGDEFGILLRYCTTDVAQRICESIAQELQESKFKCNEGCFEVNAGIGIISINGSISNLEDAVSAANAACNMAKERGKNHVACYNGEDVELIEKRQEVLYANELRNAIENNRIVLFQQRINNGGNSEHDSFEILCRIQNKEGELLAPMPYLNAAERYNITPDLDRQVVQQTLYWLQTHPNIYQCMEYMSINISGLSICDENFTDFITSSIESTGVPPNKICFEITETAAISNFVHACNFIVRIRDLGCKFALDDFGSGMSSFAYLKNLPVDILKIDGQFVKDILSDPIDLAMVKSINDIGHVMGLKTVAEYVENEEILKVLKGLGVDSFQGYEIAKPEPLDKLVEMIEMIEMIENQKTG